MVQARRELAGMALGMGMGTSYSAGGGGCADIAVAGEAWLSIDAVIM